MSNFDDVRLFHETFGQPSLTTPTLIPKDRADLRIELIDEEFIELKEAIAANDLVGIADALTDILYVTYGAGVEYGVDLDACFAEVQRSNMSKLGEDGKPIYRADGKVLKGPNYSQPDLKAVLDKQATEIKFAKFVADAERVEETRTAEEFGADFTYLHCEMRNGIYTWSLADELISHDFNREIGHPGDENLDEYKENGCVAIRCDGDFWVVAVLPYEFLALDVKTLVKHLWPEIYALNDTEFLPDSTDPYWETEEEYEA